MQLGCQAQNIGDLTESVAGPAQLLRVPGGGCARTARLTAWLSTKRTMATTPHLNLHVWSSMGPPATPAVGPEAGGAIIFFALMPARR